MTTRLSGAPRENPAKRRSPRARFVYRGRRFAAVRRLHVLGRMQTLDDDQLATVHGGMDPKMFAAWQKAVSLGGNISHSIEGPHYPNSFHWVGRAADIHGSPAVRQQFFDWAKTTNPTELIYQKYHSLRGRPATPIPGHDDHVHIAY